MGKDDAPRQEAMRPKGDRRKRTAKPRKLQSRARAVKAWVKKLS